MATGGAPPSPTLLARMDGLGHDGHPPLRAHRDLRPGRRSTSGSREWDGLDADELARLKARQGVGNVDRAAACAWSTSDGADVPPDGETIGEIALRGNDVMLGYYRDDEATAARSTLDGWFRTGDLGVVHPDGYVEIRDRRKDVIISGGENIASVEVERALDSHPAVLECGGRRRARRAVGRGPGRRT